MRKMSLMKSNLYLLNACRIAFGVALSFIVTACDGGDGTDKKPGEDEDLMGTLTVLGETYPCKVETQIFPSSKEFSVICQNDDVGLVQTTFKDADSARIVGDFTLIKRIESSHADPKTVDVQYLALGKGNNTASDDSATGTVVVSGSSAPHVLNLTSV